jgi:hypothetical protein
MLLLIYRQSVQVGYAATVTTANSRASIPWTGASPTAWPVAGSKIVSGRTLG